MSATPTGRGERVDGQDFLVLERSFQAAPEDVWASVTEPERLARWIGTWTGDPATGRVEFSMNAEGDEGATPTIYVINRCEPPWRLEVETTDDVGHWVLAVDIAASGPTTTLTLRQLLDDLEMVENTGPGWEWYLDRLVAAVSGDDVGSFDFDRDYYPAQQAYYQAVAQRLRDDG